MFVLQSTPVRHLSTKLLLLWCDVRTFTITPPPPPSKKTEVVILTWCTSILLRTFLQSWCYCNVMLSHVSCCRSPFTILPPNLLLLWLDVHSYYMEFSLKAAVIAMWCTFIVQKTSPRKCCYCNVMYLRTCTYVHPMKNFPSKLQLLWCGVHPSCTEVPLSLWNPEVHPHTGFATQ